MSTLLVLRACPLSENIAKEFLRTQHLSSKDITYIQDIGVVWFYSTYDFSFADYEKDLPMISESQEYIMQAKKEAAKFATAKTAINLKKFNTRNLQLGRL